MLKYLKNLKALIQFWGFLLKIPELTLHIEGAVECEWTESEEVQNSRGYNYTENTCYRGTDEILKSTIDVIPIETDILPGHRTYNFTFQVPQDAPSSLDENKGNVKYTVQGVLHRPSLLDLKFQKDFVVIQPIEYILDAKFKSPIQQEDIKNFRSWFLASDEPITLTASIPQSGYTVGQKIPIKISINNTSSLEILFVEVTLQKRVKYMATLPRYNQFHEKFAVRKKCQGSSFSKRSKKYNIEMEIPDTVASTNNLLSNIIEVRYVLIVKAMTSDGHKIPTVVLPVTIGTSAIQQNPSLNASVNNEFQNARTSLPSAPIYNAVKNEAPQMAPIHSAVRNTAPSMAPQMAPIHSAVRNTAPSMAPQISLMYNQFGSMAPPMTEMYNEVSNRISARISMTIPGSGFTTMVFPSTSQTSPDLDIPPSGEIRFENNPDKIVYEGQQVAGIVEINVIHAIRVQRFTLHIEGVAKCEWTETEEAQNSRGFNYTETVHYRGTDKIMNVTLNLIPTEREIQLGRFIYNFIFQVPQGAPSSVQEKKGEVQYTLRAVLHRPSKKDFVFKSDFKVVRSINLNLDPQLRSLLQKEDSKILRSCPVILTASIPQTGYIVGEKIPIKVSINNSSSVEILHVEVILLKRIKYMATTPSSKQLSEKLEVLKQNHGSSFSKCNKDYNLEMEVPSTVPSTNNPLAKVIDICYVLIVKAMASDGCKSPEVCLPITIGTVPIQQNYVPTAPNISEFPYYVPEPPSAPLYNPVRNMAPPSAPIYSEASYRVSPMAQMFNENLNVISGPSAPPIGFHSTPSAVEPLVHPIRLNPAPSVVSPSAPQASQDSDLPPSYEDAMKMFAPK